MSGPLTGITIIEFSGIGPGPFCGMVLADMGAEVIRIDRLSNFGQGNKLDFQSRSKLSLSADLKDPKTIEEIKKSIDAFLESVIPANIRRQDKMALPPALSEHQILAELRSFANKNQIKSIIQNYIGKN